MANELRVRSNFLGGLIEDNPLASGATTLTSAGLASLPAITSTSHMAIILDPDGRAGNPEIAYVTAHTALATTATITKGQEGTTGRAHDRDTPWLHGPTIKDFDAAGGGSGLIGFTQYNPVATLTTTSSATYADLNASLAVTFTVPPSGTVLVELTARGGGSTAACELGWNLREGGADIANSFGHMTYTCAAEDWHRLTHAIKIAGLTPGTVTTWKWGHARISGAGPVGTGYGGVHSPALMRVWAVNL